MMKFLRRDEQEHLQFGLKWASMKWALVLPFYWFDLIIFRIDRTTQAGGVMRRAWTKAKPTKEGWYWIRFRDGQNVGNAVICQLKLNEQAVLCLLPDNDDEPLIPLSEYSNREWSGPIDPPREARDKER